MMSSLAEEYIGRFKVVRNINFCKMKKTIKNIACANPAEVGVIEFLRPRHADHVIIEIHVTEIIVT